MTDISRRKEEHLDLCATDAVEARERTTLFEAVTLVHDALPELDLDAIDLGTTLLGHRLRAPLVISGMTGGVPRAERLNRDLATAAQRHGLAMGTGSMRPLLEHGQRDGYFLRAEAPDALLIGNLGLVQARAASDQALVDLVGATGVDALALHLNVAQEVVMADGDRSFRGGWDRIAQLVTALPVPILVKETGCGLSAGVARRLGSAGVRAVDVAGAGGTSWVGVETLRSRTRSAALGATFWDWGIPTAAAVLQCAGQGIEIVATGGVRHGLDVAKAIALGAGAAGLARPFLVAHGEGGLAAVDHVVHGLVDEIRTAMLLTGSADLAALREAPRVLAAELSAWQPPLGR